MDFTIIFPLIGLTIFILLFILQIILCFSYQFDSKDLNNLISNWKKSPIVNFSNNFNEEGYQKDDFITIEGKEIYVKRMNKKYNYLYLKLREVKYPLKICGSDSINQPIFFRNDEECPINYINDKNNTCDSTKSNCLFSNISYSNQNINGLIAIDINTTNDNFEIISYISKSNNYIYNNYENIFTIKSRIKIINIISLIMIILCIPFLFILLDNKSHEHLTYISYFIFLLLSILLIICYLLAISWIKETNSIFEDLNLSEYKMKDRFYNIEVTNLCFIILSTIFVILYSILFNLGKYNLNPLILIILISSPIILSPIIIVLFITLKPYYNSREFNDLKLNYQKSPITEIEIGEHLKLNYIYTDIINEDDEYLNDWKGYSFNIERMDKKYTYPYIINYNSTNKKLCGHDSVGNELYFPNDVDCPINYIVINNIEDYQPFELIDLKTIEINNNTYIHYTNEYTNGTILVDLRISTYYNDEGYVDYENRVDEDGYINIDNNTDKQLFLYSRTYSGIRNIEKLGNDIFTIRKFFIANNIIFIIFYILIVIFTSICFLFINDFLKITKQYLFILSFLNFILSLIILIFNSKLISKDKRIKKQLLNIKQLDEGIEGWGYFVYIILISILSSLGFLGYSTYLFFTDFGKRDFKCTIPEIFVLNKKINKYQPYNSERNKLANSENSELESLRKELIKLNEEENELQKQYEENEKNYKIEKDKIDDELENLNSRLEKLNKEKNDKLDIIEDLNKEIKHNQNMIDNIKSTNSILISDISNLEKEIDEIKIENQNNNEEFRNLKKEHDIFQKDYIKLIKKRNANN